jgi:hypothetical protein
MRPVMIVLPQVTLDAFPCLLQVPAFGQSNFLFLQAPMKAFNVAVSFRVMVSRAAMGDPQPLKVEGLPEVRQRAFDLL